MLVLTYFLRHRGAAGWEGRRHPVDAVLTVQIAVVDQLAAQSGDIIVGRTEQLVHCSLGIIRARLEPSEQMFQNDHALLPLGRDLFQPLTVEEITHNLGPLALSGRSRCPRGRSLMARSGGVR